MQPNDVTFEQNPAPKANTTSEVQPDNPWTSIYNEFLVPCNPEFRSIEDRFLEMTRGLLSEAMQKKLNPREVAHQFASLVHIAEAELVIPWAANADLARVRSKRLRETKS